jgi:hypothetical protein
MTDLSVAIVSVPVRAKGRARDFYRGCFATLRDIDGNGWC